MLRKLSEALGAGLLALTGGASSAYTAIPCGIVPSSFSQIQAAEVGNGQGLQTSVVDLYTDVFVEEHPPSLKRTCSELRQLVRLAALRSVRKNEIECEVELSCFRIGGYSISPQAPSSTKPMTRWLILESLSRLEPILYREKARFDRIRPSRALKTLGAALPVPSHASYPSGHAASATIIAEILAELAPAKKRVFRRDARRIAQNREIAGLHYPSDSAAGVRLAHIALERFHSEAWFKDSLPVARCEWGWC